MSMLGDVIEVSIVVQDLEAAIKRFETLFGLKLYQRRESKQFGFKNAILPWGKGHIDLIQPVDPSSTVARFLETHGEGIYMVGFEGDDIPASAKKLRERGARVTEGGSADDPRVWLHPKDIHGLFVELRKPEEYS